MMPGHIRVAWVDHCRLTRECMTIALSQANSPISLIPFASFADLLGRCAIADVDLVVLRANTLEDYLPQQIASLRKAGFPQPIVLVTEDDEADQIAAVKHSLSLGASGHLSTRSTSIEMAITSLAFAYEGGTFASLNLLLSEDSPERRKPAPRSSGRGARETYGARNRLNVPASAPQSEIAAEEPRVKSRRIPESGTASKSRSTQARSPDTERDK
jgi:DNA-binding NarL/FixJ family response regulator